MQKIFVTAFSVVIFLTACSKTDQIVSEDSTSNNVLMLKVDYLTNAFEGGKELTYSTATSTFSITTQYKAPTDFGSIKLTYQELNQPLFDGTIVWMGKGQILFPTGLLSADQFNSVTTTDIVYPAAGFENIVNMQTSTYDYSAIWLSIQRLVKVREYLKRNPNATVKLFVYAPSAGPGSPADADWIIFMKN